MSFSGGQSTSTPSSAAMLWDPAHRDGTTARRLQCTPEEWFAIRRVVLLVGVDHGVEPLKVGLCTAPGLNDYWNLQRKEQQ